ncbi:molybdenum cofactor biosynthesis protein MoaE [Terricaulis sp.]|uniref:molybdenum cofactor biosynthesis protein MoaE n=1 Tax=Terricaulis sp. TaxID=2768686 RepID=UPI0037839C47
MIRVIITSEPFLPDDELRAFAHARGGQAGAMASFVGYCRDASADGAVSHLELDHYPGFTEAEVTRLAERVAARHALLALLVIHRVGAIPAHDPIVLVATLSSHRTAAFAAVAEMMDYLKTDAPFWKREAGPHGARWIEPNAADYARRAEHLK